jgi:CRISPR-associated endonuclease/helicase Cas3
VAPSTVSIMPSVGEWGSGHGVAAAASPRADLSGPARAAWAKWDRSAGQGMPLDRHLLDALEVAGRLWDGWLPVAARRQISRCLPGGDADGRRLLCFLAGSHDIGKLTLAFAGQVPHLADAMREAGLDFAVGSVVDRGELPHALAGHVVLRDWLVSAHGWAPGVARTYAVVSGSHHGVPPSLLGEGAALGRPRLFGRGPWVEARRELLEFVAERAGVVDRLALWRDRPLPQPVQVLVTAAVILADWLASDRTRFSYEDVRTSDQRAEEAWADLRLPPPWSSSPSECDDVLFAARFGAATGGTPRPLQRTLMGWARACAQPGLVLVEGTLGGGKTEGALLAAELLAVRFGFGGVFVALPTMATSDAMFERVHAWVRAVGADGGCADQSLFLAHGRARLNETFSGLAREWDPAGLGQDDSFDEDRLRAIAHSWLTGRKKGPLANIVVGTIDQVLFTTLKSRHVMLRHLALANKVVVIDEAHAADTHMRVFLGRALEWLGAYGAPVIMLSATLPPELRRAFVESYQRGRAVGLDVAVSPLPPVDLDDVPYPVVVATTDESVVVLEVEAEEDGAGGCSTVTLEYVADDDEALLAALGPLAEHGGCIAVVRNTVSRAQATARVLSDHFGADAVELLHSRFIAVDRQVKERTLVEEFGPPAPAGTGRARPGLRIVVGTQVIEQSLDVDFDLMVCDLAPIDLLLQRVGRLHRHRRGWRPEWVRAPRCLITGARDWGGGGEPPTFVRGSRRVYGDSDLLRAAATLRACVPDAVLRLPDDIPRLVAYAYAADFRPPEAWREVVDAAEEVAAGRDARRRAAAAVFVLGAPQRPPACLVGWLDQGVGEADEDSQRAQRHVRDGEDALEVVVVQRVGDGVRVLPWVPEFGGQLIETDGPGPPDDAVAKAVSACTLRLPSYVGRGGQDLLDALEKNAIPSWRRSRWLTGQLVLVLDEDLSWVAGPHRLTYDRRQGLVVCDAERT